jgi:ADP-heptose:LPS heptosyltransferase
MRRLFIRPGAIGDCLCWLPVLAALGPQDAEVWAPGAVLPLLKLAPSRRNLAATGFFLLGIPGSQVPEETLCALRGFDEIFSWSGSNQPDLQQACQRLRLPVQFFPALPDALAREHVSDWFLRQTQAWHGHPAEPPAWRQPGGRRFLLPFLPAQRSPGAALNPPSRLVVLHPFSGSAAKNWPLAHFRALAGYIQELGIPDLRVQWCAGPEDPMPADLLAGAWRFPNLAELAEVLDHGDLFIGNDSGITHLAAMLGIPCLVFFGPMSPRVWMPRGAAVRVAMAREEGHPAAELPYQAGRDALDAFLVELGWKIA